MSKFRPITPRGGLFDYASPASADPSAIASYEYSSETRNATLCGFSEYPGYASVPPKKYRRLSSYGNFTLCYHTGTSCVSPYFVIDSYSFDVADVVYNSTTCVPNTVPVYHWVKSSSVCGFHQDGAPSFVNNVTQATSPTATGFSIVFTPTTYTRTGLGTCVTEGPNYRSIHGTHGQVISDEDTEADALARAAPVSGTSNVAYREARGAGDFSFIRQTCSVLVNATGLAVGQTYQITVPTEEADYGGGNEEDGQIDFSFVASAESEGVLITVPEAASGKQITVGVPALRAQATLASSSPTSKFRPFTPRTGFFSYVPAYTAPSP